MKRWIWLIWIPCLTVAHRGLSADSIQDVTTLTLDDAVAYARRHNPDLAAARWSIEEARGRMSQAGRLGPPELNSEFQPNVAGREGILSLGFTQRFPAAAQLRAERAVSRSGFAAAEAEVRDAERRVTREVASLSVEGLALLAQQGLKDRQIANSRELAEASRRSAQRGEGSTIDTAQFELETRQLELERLRLDAQRAENLAELRSWLGWPNDTGLQLTGELPAPVDVSPGGLDPDRRPDYRAAIARSEAARHAVALARASRWEEISVGVFGEVDRREDAPIGLEDEGMVGLRLSVPLPVWGRFRGRIDEASASANRAEKEAEALVVRIRAESAVARVRMDAAARQAAEIERELLPRAADLEKRLGDSHQQGQATLTDVLRARERRLGLEATALTLRRDYHVAKVRYDAATGNGRPPGNPPTEARPPIHTRQPRRKGFRRARSACWGGKAIPRFGWVLILAVFLSLPVATVAAVPAPAAEPPVVLDASTVQNLRLQTVTVGRRVFEETVFALGRIRVAPGHQAFVSSRVAGRALRVDAHIDARVEAGTELVVVESRLAGDPPPNVILKAPMSGWIAAVNLALGQPVSPDAVLIEIVDLAEVHAVAAVPEHRVGRLKLGNRARLRVSALPGREFEAELAHFAAEADAVSGTLDAAFHVSNPDAALRPGMRAEFAIIVDSRPDVLSVPREAIQGDLGSRSVFLREPERTNAFVRVPVVLGIENDRQVEVIRGLKAGDEVVARGAYSLAFAGRGAVSLRASLDAAHGHAHNEDGSEKEEKNAPATAAHANPGPDDGHDHEHDHDHAGEEPHDHDHDAVEQGRGSGKPGTWTIFFASTTALLLVLLILSVVRSRTLAAVGVVSGTAAAGGLPDSKRNQGDSHA
jgi:outer membrane protein TolC/biotin carboxyl carrier protein